MNIRLLRFARKDIQISYSFLSLRAKRNNLDYNELMEKIPCVYILTSKRNGTIYVGVTSNLKKRIFEHKSNLIDGFTKRYKIHHLVYYEIGDSMESAIEREKQIKGRSRDKKIILIEKNNPEWKDLYTEL